jgi:uncharacterized membrane protein YvbJ
MPQSKVEICDIRKEWKEDLEKAVTAVREKKMETLKAAKLFKVPRNTLQTLAKKVTLPPSKKKASATKLGHKTFLGVSFEQDESELDLPPGQKRPQTDDSSCQFCDVNLFEDSKGELWVQGLMCSV